MQPRTTQAETAGWRHTKYCRDGDATRNTTEGRDVTQNTLARGHVSQNTTGDVIHAYKHRTEAGNDQGHYRSGVTSHKQDPYP